MSIDIEIIQKGLIKRTLPLDVILGKNLRYGHFNGCTLEVNELKGGEFICFDPSRIERGFSVILSEKEKEKIVLRALTPTGCEELKSFYDCVKRIAEFWKCELEVDGQKCSLNEFLSGFEQMAEFNLTALKNMSQAILNGEHKSLTLFSAMFPIVLGDDEAKKFAEAESLEEFEQYLHEKQSIDAYYANPRIYYADRTCLGAYVLSEDVRSIFPLKPTVPFGMTDSSTGRTPEVGKWKLFMFSHTENATIDIIDYENWYKAVPKEKVSRFDGGNILIEKLTLEEMKAVAEKNKKDDE